MPELPEVESVRRSLSPHLVGRVMRKVEVRRKDIIRGDDSRSALLGGDRVVRLHRRGKQLGIEGERGGVVIIHLGMSGQALVGRRGETIPTHTHIIWRLDGPADGRPDRLLFRDPRRFGGVWTYPSLKAAEEERWAQLGPEGVSVTSDQLGEALRRSRRRLKSLLLMQERVAGLGNIYTDESLFRARLSPMRRADSLSAQETEVLAQSIRDVLTTASDLGGSTLDDDGYRDGDGAAGRFQHELLVYGRGGAPCRVCGDELALERLDQRSTVWCPTCQR